jgi:hypothetical protein
LFHVVIYPNGDRQPLYEYNDGADADADAVELL